MDGIMVDARLTMMAPLVTDTMLQNNNTNRV